VFIFGNFVAKAIARLRHAPVNMYGAEKVGKTSVLQHVQRELNEPESAVVNCRGNAKAGLRRLIDWSRDKNRTLLIDDVDQLLFGDGLSDEELRAAVSALTKLVGNQEDRPTRLLTTTTGKFYDPLGPRPAFFKPRRQLPGDVATICSNIVTQLSQARLDPWGENWAERWQTLFDKEFERFLRDFRNLHLWRDVILDVTGGIPALFGPVVRRLDTELSSLQKRTASEFETVSPSSVWGLLRRADTPHIDRLIKRHVEAWLDDENLRDEGLPFIKRVIRKLRDTPKELENWAFKRLVDLARGKEHHVWPEEKRQENAVRDLLIIECGVMYEDPTTKDCMIPGTALAEVVLLADRGAPPSTEQGVQLMRIEPDPTRPGRGAVVISNEGREERIVLRGRPWLILEFLQRNQGVEQSLEAIAGGCKLRNVRAVQNGIAILKAKLKESGIKESAIPIINRRDRGYYADLPI
jgi:hypothetical protein